MYKGVFTPTVTIFTSEGGIDWDANEKLIESLIAENVTGIVALGSIGEFFSLNFDEKKRFIEFVTGVVKKRTKVIVGTGDDNVENVIALNHFCAEKGVDAALVVNPNFFGFNDEYIYHFYATIAEKSDIDILLYNFPAKNKYSLPWKVVLKLCQTYSNIVGIKDSSDSISSVRRYIENVKSQRKDFSVLSGFDEYFIHNLMSGGDGMIGGLSNIKCKLFMDTFQAFHDKDFAALRDYQVAIDKLMEVYDLDSVFIKTIKKAVAMKLGLDIPTCLRNYHLDKQGDNRINEALSKIIN